MIAALFVQRGGAYWDLPGVDPWDEARDARLYEGPWPVVAHPPCARWSQYRFAAAAIWGTPPEQDGGCFASALASVRRWGGVLEHPAMSAAWFRFGLPHPHASGWQRDVTGGWCCAVSQGHYGHRCDKRTWLYYVGHGAPPILRWGLSSATGLVDSMHSKARSATPPAFRDLLLSIARSVSQDPDDEEETAA